MDVDEVPATGSRPDRLAGVRPQERVQQHPVDQIVDTAPALPILDVPVPLMGEQLVDVLHFFNTLCPVAEQVIDVPKISLEDIPARRFCRVPQLVEQLVEVPTVLSYSSFLQRTVEQTVDNPASRGRGRGSLPEFPVEVFKVFSQDRVQQRLPLTFQFLVAIFKVSSLAKFQQPLLLTLLMLKMRLVWGFFALFPVGKKCGVRSRPESDRARQCQLMDAGGL